MKTIITEREKAIIIYGIRTGRDKTTEDWKNLYILSRSSQTEKQASENLYLSNVSTWKNQKIIKDFYNDQCQIWREEQQKKNEDYFRIKIKGCKTVSENGEENTTILEDGINFQDREQFLTFLNSQANKITDDKQRLDYLKLISDLLRLKETDNKGTDEIQRFYTPLQCSTCRIYQNAKQIEKD